jgi:hypothetical protein
MVGNESLYSRQELTILIAMPITKEETQLVDNDPTHRAVERTNVNPTLLHGP